MCRGTQGHPRVPLDATVQGKATSMLTLVSPEAFSFDDIEFALAKLDSNHADTDKTFKTLAVMSPYTTIVANTKRYYDQLHKEFVNKVAFDTFTVDMARTTELSSSGVATVPMVTDVLNRFYLFLDTQCEHARSSRDAAEHLLMTAFTLGMTAYTHLVKQGVVAVKLVVELVGDRKARTE